MIISNVFTPMRPVPRLLPLLPLSRDRRRADDATPQLSLLFLSFLSIPYISWKFPAHAGDIENPGSQAIILL